MKKPSFLFLSCKDTNKIKERRRKTKKNRNFAENIKLRAS